MTMAKKYVGRHYSIRGRFEKKWPEKRPANRLNERKISSESPADWLLSKYKRPDRVDTRDPHSAGRRDAAG
jgi:hypothetical protein